VPSMCNVIHCSFFVFNYMFRPNWPSSGVQFVMVKYSAARCNAVFFPSVVVASSYFWLCGLPSVLFRCPWVPHGCFSVICDAVYQIYTVQQDAEI
jgi:hypothetical protein